LNAQQQKKGGKTKSGFFLLFFSQAKKKKTPFRFLSAFSSRTKMKLKFRKLLL